jgi:YD repeat-containing protein
LTIQNRQTILAIRMVRVLGLYLSIVIVFLLTHSTGYAAISKKYYHGFEFSETGAVRFLNPSDIKPTQRRYYEIVYTDTSPFVRVEANGLIVHQNPPGFPALRPIAGYYYTPSQQLVEQLFFDNWGRLIRIQTRSDNGELDEEWRLTYDAQGRLSNWQLLNGEKTLLEERQAVYRMGVQLSQQYVIWQVLGPTGSLRYYTMTWFNANGKAVEWRKFDRNKQLLIRLVYEYYNTHARRSACHIFNGDEKLTSYETYTYHPWGGLSFIVSYSPNGSINNVWYISYDESGATKHQIM